LAPEGRQRHLRQRQVRQVSRLQARRVPRTFRPAVQRRREKQLALEALAQQQEASQVSRLAASHRLPAHPLSADHPQHSPLLPYRRAA
jgi:hypothetical protein